MKRRKTRSSLAVVTVLGMLLALLPLTAISAAGHIHISEIHYDNTGTDTGEAIEVTAPVGMDMADWSIVLYNGNGGAPYNTTDLAGTVPVGGAFTISYPTNGIQNGSPDGIALVDPDSNVVEFLSYEGSFVGVGGPADGLTSTDIGVSEPNTTPIGHSLQKVSDVWVGPQASDFAPELEVPTPQCDATDLTLISEVQGSGFESPLDGEVVTVRAVVTLADSDLDGYFLQEEPADSDGDPATSEGLFVFDRRTLPSEGQTVQLTDRVTSYRGLTQLSFPEMVICDEPLVNIIPTEVFLPLDDLGRESLEGMLVTNGQDLQVTGLFTAYGFGELGLALNGPLSQPTSVYAPDDPLASALEDLNAMNELKVNDRNEAFSSFSPYPWELFDDDLSAGDTMPAGRLVGALGYSFGEYKVEPLDEVDFPETEDTFPRPAAPTLEDGNDIGAFNVLNYFNTFGDSDVLRGARSQEQFDDQSEKIVDAILNLDVAVLGLIELENDYEDLYDGDPATEPSIQTLVDQLNDAAGSDVYDWIRVPETLLTDEGLGGGGLGPDAIAVGIIYQPDRAAPVGDVATFDIDALLTGDDTNKNRWPLAASFNIDGEVVTIVVNHFKSKGSPCDDVTVPAGYGDGQDDPLTANCDLVREYAAERLIEWNEMKPTGVNSPDTFVVGDLNSYEEEDPVRIFEEAGYLDLVEKYDDGAFTYKFSGRYGRLDYILASPSAKRLVDDAEVWQVNSPEPYGYLYYNDPVDLTAYASSDHDPVVAAISKPGKGPMN